MGGFGMYFKQPASPPPGAAPFGPAKWQHDPKMAMMSSYFRMPFQPHGMEVLTRFTHNHDSAALRADPSDPKSPHTGWVTHPCGAPDNHLLTVWTGLVHQGRVLDRGYPAIDSGIYLIKDGRPFWEPGEMLLIKNDPNYNEQWPRPLVPYKRIYGVDEPERLPALRNDGKLSKHLPEGTPFGLVGTSSLYKRESYPNGAVPKGSVTAVGAPYSAFPTREHRTNWDGQGSDAGLYTNSDIHAIRILAMEPPSLGVAGKFRNQAGERLRILGEFPVRHFVGVPPLGGAVGKDRLKPGLQRDGQPLDLDGNPDTSFLAKIPADVAWTFQTLDRDGMVLNMAQTWHQLRPGEIRNNCGGCHAHSQQPTPFEKTAAARPDYVPFDLTQQTPLLTSKKHDQSGQKWDVKDETGVRFEKTVKNVEYYRDVKPILDRSCAACHTASGGRKPPGNLVLDDDKIVSLPNADDVPGTYYRLTMDYAGRFGHKPVTGAWRGLNASRYIRMFQSRRSLLIWKVFGERTDGWTNDDFPTESEPGNPRTLRLKGQPVPDTLANRNRADLDYTGPQMPPPEAVAGTYVGPDGQKIKVAPLTDEDRRTLVRWIDLGCPIDLDYNPASPQTTGYGWMLDDQRPTLTLASPRAGANPPLTRLLVGMHDYGGLDSGSFEVTASFPVAGIAAGKNLAAQFRSAALGVWELPLVEPLTIREGKLTVSVRDRQGNVTRIERTFSATR